MGYYIQGPAKGKASYIIEEYGASKWCAQDMPPKWEEIDPSEAIICVVENAFFDAAAFAFDEKELEAFKPTPEDQRPRTWLIMDRAKAEELTNFNLKEDDLKLS